MAGGAVNGPLRVMLVRRSVREISTPVRCSPNPSPASAGGDVGFGGPRMAAAGAELVGDFRGFSVTGLVRPCRWFRSPGG
jgi:hypothetical protein